jgi:hypothetical protein
MMSEEQTTFEWSPLGEKWWREAAAACTHKLSERQLRFAVVRHDGLTATDAARRAGYTGEGERMRQAGSRADRSAAVQELLAYAHAETGTGSDGVVKTGEAKRILSRIARKGDNNARIKALESLAKIDRDERDTNKTDEFDQDEGIREMVSLMPSTGVGAAVAMAAFFDSYQNIINFPFLKETAPLVAKQFPEEWAKWRTSHESNWQALLDKMAAGPVLCGDDLLAALRANPKSRRASAINIPHAEPDPPDNMVSFNAA